MHRVGLIVSLLLGNLAACGSPEPDAPPAVDAAPIEVAAFPRWNDGGDAAILVLEDADRRPLARLACEPGALVVEVADFSQIASEDRLTLGVGGDAWATAAQLDGSDGVRSRGPAPDGLYDAMAGAGPLGFSYGAQTLQGPQLPVDLAVRFAEACKVMG